MDEIGYCVRVYSNIPTERLINNNRKVSVLGAQERDLLFLFNGETGMNGPIYAAWVYDGFRFVPWIPEDFGILKLSLRLIPHDFSFDFAGSVYFTDQVSFEFPHQHWGTVCQLLSGKISAQEFNNLRLQAEIGTLRKRVDELGKLATAYDAERRRFSSAISKAAGDLYQSRRFVKSRRIQQIREGLEATLRG